MCVTDLEHKYKVLVVTLVDQYRFLVLFLRLVVVMVKCHKNERFR